MKQMKLTTAIAMIMPLMAGPAFAQDASVAVDEEYVAETIVVTASRREENLQDVPASVSSTDPQVLIEAGKTSIKDIVELTPGVYAEDLGRPGATRFSARGIPQIGNTAVFGIYLDDTPLTSSSSFTAGTTFMLDGLLLDLERVEVIKGPQGTLFGASALSGIARYITKEPALQEVRGSVSADVSWTNEGEMSNVLSARVSAPLIKDKLGITLSGYRQEFGGYIDQYDNGGTLLAEDIDSSEVEAYAADMLFRANDRLDFRLKYIHQKTTVDAGSRVRLESLTSDKSPFGTFGTSAQPEPMNLEYDIVSGTFDYDFDFATFTSTTSRSEYDVETRSDESASALQVDFIFGLPLGTTQSLTNVIGISSERFTQEFKLTSDSNKKLEWILGAFYVKEEGTNSQDLVVVPDTPIKLFQSYFPNDYEEYAVFGDVTYYLTDQFDVTVGARLSENEVGLVFDGEGLLVVGPNPPISINDSVKDTVDTYLFTGRYRPTDDLSLYARIANGYRPASPNIPLADQSTGEVITFPVVESDSGWSYEAGAKGRLLNGRVNYDAAIWTVELDKVQSPLIANGINTLQNAKSGLEAYGIDAAMQFKPTTDFEVGATFSYAQSELKEDEPGFGGVKGEQLPMVPEYKAGVQWQYTHDLTPDWTGSFSGSVVYTGEQTSRFAVPRATFAGKLDARTITDLSLNATNGSVRVGLYVKNLFDERALSTRTDTDVNFDNIYTAGLDSSTGIYVRPRTIGVNVGYTF